MPGNPIPNLPLVHRYFVPTALAGNSSCRGSDQAPANASFLHRGQSRSAGSLWLSLKGTPLPCERLVTLGWLPAGFASHSASWRARALRRRFHDFRTTFGSSGGKRLGGRNWGDLVGSNTTSPVLWKLGSGIHGEFPGLKAAPLPPTAPWDALLPYGTLLLSSGNLWRTTCRSWTRSISQNSFLFSRTSPLFSPLGIKLWMFACIPGQQSP